MSINYQHTTIVGRLGRDPEMRYTPSGSTVTNFSVAVTEKRNDNEYTTWYKVTAWAKLAENCNQYLVKGQEVLVEGRVSVEAWKNKEGEPQATLVLNARNVRFGAKPRGSSQPAGNEPQPAGNEQEVPF